LERGVVAACANGLDAARLRTALERLDWESVPSRVRARVFAAVDRTP
jgi:hypothetical protein